MAWALVNSWTYAVPVANVDFTGLSAYSDVRVMLRNVTLSGSAQRAMRVSIDNGATFLSTASDYIFVGSDGAKVTATSINLHATASALARTCEIEINGFNLTSPKVSQLQTRTDLRTVVLPTASALSAIRILDSTAALNLTGGNIYVYGR